MCHIDQLTAATQLWHNLVLKEIKSSEVGHFSIQNNFPIQLDKAFQTLLELLQVILCSISSSILVFWFLNVLINSDYYYFVAYWFKTNLQFE